MSFGNILGSAIRSWTMLETSIGAVSRLKSFSATVPDENTSDEIEKPLEEWPQMGVIEINHVSASYKYVKYAGKP
jgi:ATP-binding cassette subfamily C (CFTR/MRP) protein 1